MSHVASAFTDNRIEPPYVPEFILTVSKAVIIKKSREM